MTLLLVKWALFQIGFPMVLLVHCQWDVVGTPEKTEAAGVLLVKCALPSSLILIAMSMVGKLV
jgi:hypothetical protein